MWGRIHKGLSAAWQELGLLWYWWVGELHDLAVLVLTAVLPHLKLRTHLTLDRTGGQIAVLRSGEFKPLFSLRKEVGAPWPLDLRPFGSVEVIQRTRTAVALSSEFALTRELVFPEATERELDRVIPLYLEREFPLSLSAISFSYSILRRMRATRQLVVRIVIVRRDDLDAVLTAVRSWGMIPVQVGMSDETSYVRGNFMQQTARRIDKSWGAMERWLFAFWVLCGLAVVVTIATHWGYERHRLGLVLSQVQASAATVKAASARVEDKVVPAQRLAKITSSPDAADILTKLTERTPADTWIYQLTVDADPDVVPVLNLSAVTSATLDYLKTLDSTPEFDHVKLGSVTAEADRTGMKKIKLTASWSAVGDASVPTDVHTAMTDEGK